MGNRFAGAILILAAILLFSSTAFVQTMQSQRRVEHGLRGNFIRLTEPSGMAARRLSAT